MGHVILQIRLVLFPFVILSCLANSALAQEKPSTNLPVFYLKLPTHAAPAQTDPLEQVKPQAGDILVQELCRQSVLMAARDLGYLILRDEGVGDPEPEQANTKVHVFNVTNTYQPGQTLLVVLEAESNAKKQLWQTRLDLNQENFPILQLMESLEGVSRLELAALLKKELPPEQDASKTVGVAVNHKEIDSLLEELTFLSQFEGLRRLHVATNQNDPKVLTALAKGYAQLALLTRYHWTHLHRVFQARSLLYAQRLVMTHPKDAGKSVLAACLSFAGYQSAAIQLFEAGEKAGEKLSPWTTAGKHAALMDYQALVENGKKTDESASMLSSYLAFRILAREPTINLLGLTIPAMNLGTAIVEKMPESYPVIHRLSTSTALGIKHQMTVIGQEVLQRQMPKRLKAMKGMPDAVLNTLQDQMMVRDCHQALLKAGLTDAMEPSWSSVGNAILQTYFHQAYQRALFMHKFWVVPTKEYLEEVMPMLANHPHAALVRIAGGDSSVGGIAFVHPKTGDVRAFDIALQARPLLGEQGSNALQNQFLSQRPHNVDDLALLHQFGTNPNYRYQLAKNLYAEGPYHPLAPVHFMTSGVTEIASLIPDHEQRYAKHIPYVYEYAAWQIRMKNFPEAEKSLKKLITLNPNYTTFNTLANLYLQQNNRKQWEATLEQYLKTSDPSLQPATVRLDIAEYHASQKNWDKAKQYASEAAETYAAWALFRASRVFEMAGDWDQAENYVKNMSMRYNDSTHQWFRFCIRTEKGDRDAAFQLFKKQLELARNPNGGAWVLQAICHEAMNQPKEALECLDKAYAQLPHVQTAVRSALIESSLGNTEARDNWMVKALAPNARLTSLPDYKVELKVAEVVLKAFRTKTLPPSDIIEAILEGTPEQFKPMQYYLLGKTSEQIADVENAKALYKQGVESKTAETWGQLLCYLRLKTLDKKK